MALSEDLVYVIRGILSPHYHEPITFNKMKKILMLLGIALILTLTGCLTSIYPFFTTEDVVEVTWLEGTWQGQSTTLTDSTGKQTLIPGGTWIFAEKDEETLGYSLTQVEAGEADTVIFEAVPFKLDGTLYLDLTPVDLDLENSLAAMTLIGTHLLVKPTQQGNQLELASFNTEWLATQVEDGESSIQFETPSDGFVLLTADTQELQKLVKAYADEPEAFDELEVLTKR